jgi:cytochrome P450
MIYQTVAALMTFFVAMLLYPDIQKKAHDELDSVIGRERLPTFEDRPRLPFIDAVCKETLTWRPVAPLGAFPKYLCEISRWRHMNNILTGSCPTCNHQR